MKVSKMKIKYIALSLVCLTLSSCGKSDKDADKDFNTQCVLASFTPAQCVLLTSLFNSVQSSEDSSSSSAMLSGMAIGISATSSAMSISSGK